MTVGEWIEYRGVKARVEIVDSDVLPDKYVTVRLVFGDDRVTGEVTTARGWPSFSADVKADPIVAPTKTGKGLTDADIQALADEAERGYDVSHLKAGS